MPSWRVMKKYARRNRWFVPVGSGRLQELHATVALEMHRQLAAVVRVGAVGDGSQAAHRVGGLVVVGDEVVPAGGLHAGRVGFEVVAVEARARASAAGAARRGATGAAPRAAGAGHAARARRPARRGPPAGAARARRSSRARRPAPVRHAAGACASARRGRATRAGQSARGSGAAGPVRSPEAVVPPEPVAPPELLPPDPFPPDPDVDPPLPPGFDPELEQEAVSKPRAKVTARGPRLRMTRNLRRKRGHGNPISRLPCGLSWASSIAILSDHRAPVRRR